MTPKEKARELVDRFLKITYNWQKAKQCALLCVDEMLESLWRVGHSFCNDEIKYLKEVKKEIEKL